MPIPEISVVIGTYNLKDKLTLVLDSLRRQTLSPDRFEVIIVDSESSDGSSAFFQKQKYPYVLRWITQPNKGKAAARNTGILNANAPLVMITDADMIAHPDMLKAHLGMHTAHSGVLVQGNTWVLKQEALPAEQQLLRPYITHKVRHGQRLGFYYCLTGNLSAPKALFEQAGYFDENFVNYGWEDVALGYELVKRQKIKLLYAADAQNYHYHVWSDHEEMLRREKMGQSAHLIIRKYSRLRSFLGINTPNTLLYMTLKLMPETRSRWMVLLKQGKKLSAFKRWLLREFMYQQGYRNP